MSKIFIPILIIILIVSCEKDDFDLEKTGNIKTKYVYSSSENTDPYSFTTYSYDSRWNLVKKLLSDNPKPIYASYTYDYNENEELVNKKHFFKLGENYPDQTESSFSLVEEFKYTYSNNKTIELEYNETELTDSTVYIYTSNQLLSETHFDINDQTEWSIYYEYNSNNNLIKETSLPSGNYIIHEYKNSKIQKSTSYDSNGTLISELVFIYSNIENTEIIETYNGDFLSEKTTIKNGNVIEYIRYHPTFPGAEWYCHRYEYF